MIALQDLIKCIEDFAPLKIQESYDNSGLQTGQPTQMIERALIALDVTEEVLNEALEKKCQLIISHHPLIFGGLKRIVGANATERILIKAIENKIAIYAAHTNLDAVHLGVNHILAEKLGIENPKALQPAKGQLKKLVTFCPLAQAGEVRQAIFNAGAGHIGNYNSCSFNLRGEGTFKASEKANPFVGEINQLHTEEEIRIESIYPFYLEKKILKALLDAHPYEEVAYDIYPLENENPLTGIGLWGEIKEPMDEKAFMASMKQVLNTPSIRHSRLIGKNVKKIAVCGGSGSFLIQAAIAANADVFITSDLKYHNFYDAENKILLVDAGHYETEQFAKELLYRVVKEKFTTFAVLISEAGQNPVHYA